jgi:hypothetical protein
MLRKSLTFLFPALFIMIVQPSILFSQSTDFASVPRKMYRKVIRKNLSDLAFFEQKINLFNDSITYFKNSNMAYARSVDSTFSDQFEMLTQEIQKLETAIEEQEQQLAKLQSLKKEQLEEFNWDQVERDVEAERQKSTSGASKNESKNPFGDGGNGSVSATGFGNDSGNGTGTGDGSGAGRTRLNNPSVDHIVTDVNVTINLKLTVNENGDIVAASNIVSKTTTTDQRIINQVISAVKSQVKYSKDLDAGLVTMYLTVKVNGK